MCGARPSGPPAAGGCDGAERTRQVLDLAAEAGHVLLENGAEIFRVEETIDRICRRYGVEAENYFVLSNGIFITADSKGAGQYAKVQHIPVKGAQLEKVVAVNQLSREIEAGRHTPAEARRELERIKAAPAKSAWSRVLASGVGSACFCFLFGGGVADSAAAFVAGLVLYAFLIWLGAPHHLSGIVSGIAGGMLVTVVCILCCRAGLGERLDRMVIGSVIPLVPGVPFVNGIRDLAEGDYISGAVRLMDAILTVSCVAIGMGAVFSAYFRLTGGQIP